MTNLPTGTVTFLFTDIEGSTQLWEKHPEVMRAVLAKHDAILREAIESNHGQIIKTTGDGVHAVFSTAVDAINAAISAQHNLQSPISGLQIKVRMGLHTGESEIRADDYYGQTLNRATRIMSAGHGGQVLLSEITAQVAHEHLPADASLLDLGEYTLKGLTNAEQIFQLSTPDLQKEFPALMSIATATNNLPSQLTSFIGRERELREAKERLSSTRLLTLIGPGGTGKTRLSLQLAVDLLSDFSDGVWLVELAPLTDPALILQTIASVLKVRAQTGMPLQEIVVDYLRAKNLLLIFDNCEHLVDASAQLADQFLHSAPKIKIIASSREALGINGETVYRVPSLSLPDQAKASPEALEGYESIQLFVERARAANPKFDLTEKNASPVAQICRRLDGIPLAIELAAARTTVFSAEHIATRLDDRFKLLTGGSRTALPRQQTLRALIDWSYDMLDEDERALLRRLSVFAGGWIFEAAESICSDLDVLNLLTQLVNKSLVTVDDEGDEPRYRLLETVRQYARDKLMEAGEAGQLRSLHLNFFVKYAEAIEPKLEDLDGSEWFLRLEAEYDNIRTALEWGLEKDVEAAFRIILALRAFWARRGHDAEGRYWTVQSLSKQETLPKLEGEAASQQMRLIANVWESLTFLYFNQGDAILATEAAEKCMVLARQLDDKRLLAIALSYKASASIFYLGHTLGVEETAEESLMLARESEDKYALGMALALAGQALAIIKQDFKIARANIDEINALIGSAGANRWGAMMSLLGMGQTAKFFGEYEEARLRFTACLPFFRKIGDKHRFCMMESELAHLDRFEGHYEKAETAYRETILEWQRLGHRAAVANQLECFAFISKARELDERATRLFGAAEALREQIKIQMTSMERGEYDREVNDLRANMDDKAFASYWAEGRAMTMEQAIELAISHA